MRVPTMTLLAAAAMLATPALAAPGDMTVATFLAKVDGLKAKGMMALLSSDIKVLKAEGMAAGETYRKRLEAERTQGRPSSCPPKGSTINSNQLIAHLNTYAPAVRPATSLKTAFADYFIKTWPCR
ncbi:hypothetical protein ACFFF7_12775 [Novosphingobium aquiterrae]|uniref:Rap1a immunity protein domain-containing protein n=1 Tax=Novosphingobium aquiterrae TaxID=624388 RepID=A0ABV6PKC1_9SPHN